MRSLSLLLAIALATSSAPALAQGINYPSLQALFGEPVTTSVTGKPQRASEAPASLLIITRDDIRQSPASDIPGVLKTHAGIDVAQWAGDHSDVTLRGGVRSFNPTLLVLVNGQQVYLDHYGMTSWTNIGIQLEEIQQIEVVKGPNSALFGFNAASGVVNIVTINPLYVQKASVSVEAGNDGQRRLSAVAAVKLAERVGLRLSAGQEESDELAAVAASLSQPSGASLPNPDTKQASAGLYLRPDDRTELRLTGSHSDSRLIQLTPIAILGSSRQRMSSAGVEVSRDMSWGIISGRAYHNWLDIDFDPSYSGDYSHLFSNDTFVAAGNAVFRLGEDDMLRLGLEYRTNALRSVGGYPGTVHYSIRAGSAMWEHELTDAVRFTASGRVDHLKLGYKGVIDQPSPYNRDDFNRSLTSWSFNAGLFLRVDEASSLRLSGGRGVQSPSLYDLGERRVSSLPGFAPFVYSGNPAVDPAVVWSGELSYARELGLADMRFEVTAFYSRTSDIIGFPSFSAEPRSSPPATPFYHYAVDNVGSFDSHGLEVVLSGRFSHQLSWNLNYSWTDVDEDIADNGGEVLNWPFAFDTSTPAHKVNAQLGYTQGPWFGTLVARYTSATRQVGSSPDTFLLTSVPVEDALAVDAKVGLQVGDSVLVTLAGENLTGAASAGLSPFAAERRLRAGITLEF